MIKNWKYGLILWAICMTASLLVVFLPAGKPEPSRFQQATIFWSSHSDAFLPHTVYKFSDGWVEEDTKWYGKEGDQILVKRQTIPR